MTQEKTSNPIQIQLEPDETVIGQIKWWGADFMATNKRIFRIQNTGVETLDYKEISGIKQKSSIGGTILARTLCALMFFGCVGAFTVSWLGYLDGDIALIISFILSIFLIIIAAYSLIAMLFFKAGYIKIESMKIKKDMEKYWRVGRPFFSEEKVNKFFQELSKQSGIPIKQE